MNSTEQILAGMTDEQLLDRMVEAADDLHAIGDSELETEWHECCFAAVIVLSQEITRRGLSLHTTR